ncbi:hypothetical protein L5515_009022 [Caenorhabditis briggsae]|uniref:Uncharacterized protein n=1 Tax=Caenorhabditis briggsae TaxID=6238 RepID=A0AAE9JPI3_CAEBR|nr:hypothetical protein L5515_009022 [Caenorhabditis briggsae]
MFCTADANSEWQDYSIVCPTAGVHQLRIEAHVKPSVLKIIRLNLILPVDFEKQNHHIVPISTSSRYLNVKSCKHKTDLQIDSSLKKQIFIDGKSCFLRSGCFRDFDNYYDSLMDLYTTPPKGIDGKCNTFYDKFQKIQCESLKTMLRNEIRDTNGDKKFNATRIAELSERAQHCADSTCLMKPNKIGKAMVTV